MLGLPGGVPPSVVLLFVLSAVLCTPGLRRLASCGSGLFVLLMLLQPLAPPLRVYGALCSALCGLCGAGPRKGLV